MTLFTLAVLWGETASAQSADPEVSRIMAWFDHEPSVGATQQAALGWSGLGGEQEAGWRRRARWAFAAPEVLEGRAQVDSEREGRFTTREDMDALYNVEGTHTGTLDSGQSRWRGGLTARWDLSRLVFNPDELGASLESSRRTRLRIEVLESITQRYFERRQLQIRVLLSPPEDRSEAVILQLRIDELTAGLDAETGGWFSRSIRLRTPPQGGRGAASAGQEGGDPLDAIDAAP